MKRIILILANLLCVQLAFSQTDTVNKNDLIISFSFGESFSTNLQFSESIWAKYAAGFSTPQPEEGFSEYSYGFSSSYTFTHLSIGKTYSNSFLKQKNIVPSIHIIAGIGGGVTAQQLFYKYQTVRYDTLTSSSTGQQFYLDSTIQEGRSRTFSSRQFQIGIGNEYQSNPKKIVSFRLGLSLLYSFSVDQSIDFSDYKYSSPHYFSDPSGTGSTNDYTSTTQGRGPRVNAVQIQIPLGIDFRLSRRNRFFKKTSIGLEYRPVIQWIAVEKTTTVNYTPWLGMNFRYRF